MQDEFGKAAANPPPSDDWRHSMVVVCGDIVLRARIEKFLDYIQNSPQEFSSVHDPGYKFTGGDMIRGLGVYIDQYKGTDNPTLNLIGDLHLRDGKFQIVVHDKKFDGTGETGSRTIQAGDVNYPVKIEIGRDYLKTMELKGRDGKFHPVTLEGVLMNELAHAALLTTSDYISNEIENQLLRTLKYPERKLEPTLDDARLNPKPDYVSLLDRVPVVTAAPRL